MDYSKLTDFEINKRVADIAMNGTWHVKPSHPNNDSGGWLYGSNGIQTHDLPDYCNNPSDAWPLIVANGIALLPYQHSMPAAYLTAFGLASRFNAADKNVLRAAMIVFLMAQESSNVPTNSTGSDLR